MIEVDKVIKKYDEITALNEVSVHINPGEIVALLGQNGAGKSTLLKIIAGYLHPDGGSVKVFGKEYANSREQILLHIGYVPENSLLYPEMSVFDYLKLSAKLKKVDEDDILPGIKNVVEKLQLEAVVNQKTSTLSKGYKKRVEVAAALIHKPNILILDEPTEGLDPAQKEIVRSFLREYSKENVVIISTHILEEVRAVASRVVMLTHGQKTADISKARLHEIKLEDLFK